MPSVMDKEKFVTKQAKNWDSPEHFLQFHEVTPCDCGAKKCKGWQLRWKFGAERRREEGKVKPQGPSGAAGYIYFARLGDLVKVGFSKNPDERVHRLNALLLGVCKGNRELEAELHSEFSDLHERGEWFRADPRLLERMEALCE